MNMFTLSSQQHISPFPIPPYLGDKEPPFPIPPYLGDKEPPFPTLNLPDPTRIRTTLAPIITTTNNNRKSSEDDEIGVFRAEKYFNGPIITDDDDETSSSRHKPAEARISALNFEQARARIQPRTPSSAGRSETSSSWQSHNNNGLTISRSLITPTTNKKKKKKYFLPSFGCNKCSDKNSAETIKTKSNNNNAAVTKTMSLERRLTMMSSVKAPSSYNNNNNDSRDSDSSDASSDLFEIDSLTANDRPATPSEASIQWSVLTASADEDAATCRAGGRGLLLLGCMSHKAVHVAHRTASPLRFRGDSPARFQAEIARINAHHHHFPRSLASPSPRNNHSRLLFINS